MNRFFFVLAIAAGLLVYSKKKPSMVQYFSVSEFREWADYMSSDLVYKLNKFRELWGAQVVISSNADALGRNGGINDESQHNVDKWGEVRAADIFPEGMVTREDMTRAYNIAVEVGFTGIGLYNDTSKPMMHVDVRKDRVAGSPAVWSRVAGAYLSINELLV